MMLLLRNIFLLLILLSPYSVFSQAQETTAGEVFFNFVDQHTQDIEGVMGARWFDDIFEHTKLWTVSDAERFLNLLVESEYPTFLILTILKIHSLYKEYKNKLQIFSFKQAVMFL